ncbi:MAG: hypothetical protein ACI38Q_01770 [Candidatus Bruticola sp.]
MALKETFLERAGLLGCIAPTLIGGLLASALGWWLVVPKNEVEYLEGATGSIAFLVVLIGFCIGGALGFVIAFTLDYLKSRSEEQNDF